MHFIHRNTKPMRLSQKTGREYFQMLVIFGFHNKCVYRVRMPGTAKRNDKLEKL